MSNKSIEAILRLNTEPFEGSLATTRKSVNTFKNSMLNMGKESKTVESGIYNIQKALNILIPYLNRFINLTQQTKVFNSFANGLKHMSEAVMNLSNVTKSSQVGMIRIKEIINAWSNAAKGLTVNIRGNISTEQQETSTLNQLRNSYESTYASHVKLSRAVQQYDKALEVALPTQRQMITLGMGINASEREEASAHTQTANAVEKETNAKNRNVSATQRQTSANKMLGNSLSSLRMGLTMVGSMIAYNFIHKLGQATTETINAKSEMNGYFQMLKFSKSQVADFNSELDKTIQKFPRLNKYALGETISSIGVEFELTTAEMKKAMPVVSMITSEYLRAGRNVNEASLAVKDILQGEFQRLSRETGVKGDQLKEAGWSGDKNDVMGLLEALDKVGKSRNWDTFVQKANSFNDAVLIMQNRFGEWSADMVERVQPTIVSVFNMIMETAQKFSGVLDGVLNWLGGDGIEQSIVKWGGLATAITGVTTALIVYRTGANLTQIVKMGLLKSITASIFGLEAETVAEYGLRTAIVSTITGIEAETLANEENVVSSRARLVAITSTITGLEAEEVAQIGVTKSLLASLMGLDMATLKEYGFSVALAQATTQMEAQKLASMSLIKRIGLITATMGPAIAIVGAFALAFGGLAIQMNDSAKQMKKFNDTVKNGKSIIQDAKDKVQGYEERQESLKKQLSEATEGTGKYYEIQKKLNAVNRDITVSNENLKNSIKAVETAVSSKAHYEEALTDMSIEHQGNLADAYMRAGYSAQQSYEMASESLIDAQEGAEQLRVTLQRIKRLQEKGEQNTNYLLGTYTESGVDLEDPETKKHLNDAVSLNEKMQKAMEKGLTDESFMGRIDGWLSYYQYQLESWINNIGATVQSGNWGAVFENVWKGIAHGFADLPILKDFWGWIYEQIGVNDLKGTGWEGLSKALEGVATFIPEALFDAISNVFSSGLSGQPLEIPVISEWLDSVFIQPFTTLGDRIMECLVNIGTYDYLGEFLKTWGLEDFDFGTWVNDKITIPLATAFFNNILSIPLVQDFMQLFGLVNGDNSGSSQKGSDLGEAFKTAIEDKIRSIPIVGDIAQMLGLIPSQNSNAHDKGHGIGSNLDQGTQGGMGNMGSKIIQEFQDALSGIGGLGQQAYNTARDWAGQLWEGANSVLQRASPGFFHDQFKAEFGTDIPNAINEASVDAYAVGQNYATQLRDGVGSVTSNVGLEGMVQNYETDAQIVADSSQMMGINTTTAFNDMGLAINQTTSQMESNVVNSYTAMDIKQSSLLSNMKTRNTSAYNEMYLKSNQSLLQMRDSTSNITTQMTHAWNLMKDNIVRSATQLQNDSTVHFTNLSNVIGSFYRKIQNPSSWGSGSSSLTSSSARPRVGRAIAKTVFHGAGPSKYGGSSTMTIGALKNMLCPNGDCSGIFDGYNVTDIVNVNDFLRSIGGEHGFGWGDWNGTHYSHIKGRSDTWSTGSPVINLAGGIPTSSKFTVGEFSNGSPKISFGEFQSMAGSIFSAIPYKHYMDSSWKGSWLGALQSGACNCSDGADALIAFANSCGYSGYKQWGTWDGEGHFWAVINGVPMDTTAWQKGYGWKSPKVSGYGPSNTTTTAKANNVTVNVSINGNVYGVDDLNSKIEDGIDKGLQKHFNKSYSLGI